MDTWQDWVGTPVYINDRTRSTVVDVDDDGVTVVASAADWSPLRPYDVVGLIRATPLTRWWAAVREVTGDALRLGRPVRDDVDRRRHPRRGMCVPVSVWWPGAKADSSGLTVDLSVGGFSAVLDYLPPDEILVAARLEGPQQPIVAIARCLSTDVDRARFTFSDIGGPDVETLAAITLSRPARQRVVASGDAVLWSTVGSQRVTIKSTPLGCVVTGVERCPPRKEHVVVESEGTLHRATVVSTGGGVPRLGWLD